MVWTLEPTSSQRGAPIFCQFAARTGHLAVLVRYLYSNLCIEHSLNRTSRNRVDRSVIPRAGILMASCDNVVKPPEDRRNRERDDGTANNSHCSRTHTNPLSHSPRDHMQMIQTAMAGLDALDVYGPLSSSSTGIFAAYRSSPLLLCRSLNVAVARLISLSACSLFPPCSLVHWRCGLGQTF